MRFPVLFLSHESPLLMDTPSSAHDFLKGLGGALPRPRAVLLISAHWQEKVFTVSSHPNPDTIHDFSGFPSHYHKVQYLAKGSPDLAQKVCSLLTEQGIEIKEDPGRGLDHSGWVPLSLLYPEADIPVVSLSLKVSKRPEDHYQMGYALRSLRDKGILIIGSGTATHNLKGFFSEEPPKLTDPADDRALKFNEWLKERIHDDHDILQYRQKAPFASHCHPSADHFLPLIVAMGAGVGESPRVIHSSFHYRHFAMTSFQWGEG